MKKIVSLLLAGVMMVSAVPVTYAADTQDHSLGTQVTYTAANNESYFITVPAKLNPGQSGTVTLDGYWPDNKTVTVTAEKTVTLKNSIKAADTKTLNVTFLGISEAGSNTSKQTFTEPVSVEGISNALFGTWSGKFNYNVDVSDLSATETASGSYVVVNDVSASQHNLGINLSSDTITDFSSVSVTRYGSNLIDPSQMTNENFISNGDGTYTLIATGPDHANLCSTPFDINIPANTPFFTNCEFVSNNTVNDTVVFLYVYFVDGTQQAIPFAKQNNDAFEYCYEKDIVQVVLFLRDNPEFVDVGDSMTIENIKLNIGTSQEYEPYIAPQTVTATADGIVTGLTSVAPNMTIISNNSNVEITCDYLKKN